MNKFSGKVSADWVQENIGGSFLDGLPSQFDALDADDLDWSLESVELELEYFSKTQIAVDYSRDGISYQGGLMVIPAGSLVKKCRYGWLIVTDECGEQWKKWIHDFELDEEEQDWQKVNEE